MKGRKEGRKGKNTEGKIGSRETSRDWMIFDLIKRNTGMNNRVG
jgi:hypothetical protein